MRDPLDVIAEICHDQPADALTRIAEVLGFSDEDVRCAARYRWLRARRDVTLTVMFFGNGCVNKTIEMAEAKLDEAMAADGVKGLDDAQQ